MTEIKEEKLGYKCPKSFECVKFINLIVIIIIY